MAKRFYEKLMDKTSNSNMPGEVIMEDIPSVSGYSDSYLDDGITGIDNQMQADNAKKKSNKKHEKY
ncbi:MAG: hypothetical protein PHS34_09365 [Candidatus Omnitrophica bacterium]|nr:hypothetical protein [Candidatus Omnitrophota bacterium]